MMEWYDYGVFTAGAITTAIGHNFFPGEQNATLKSFALLATTILLMAGGTFLVGVLPTYAGPYSLGIGASILVVLLRLVQGFSTGGEYAGAATFIAEYAPAKRRGFFGSFLEFGTLCGYVLGNVVVLVVLLSFGLPTTEAWAWRIPFFVALPLGLIGLYLRLKLEDTPTFTALTASGEAARKPPLREALTGYWRLIVHLIGIVLLLNVADYVLLTTLPSYFTRFLGVNATTATWIVIAVEVVQIAIIAPLGALSDRVGRKPLLTTAAIGYIVLSWPAFQLMQAGSLPALLGGYLIMAVLLVCILAVIGSTFPAIFPTRVRYGAFAIGYNVSTSIFGGTAGLVVVSHIDATGDDDIPAYYLILAGIIGLAAIRKIPETAGVPMHEIGTQARPALD